PGTIKDLEKFETELLEHLGFGKEKDFHYKTYDQLKKHYRTAELTHQHEAKMAKDFGPIVLCEEFPVSTSPFWNMKRKGTDYAHKIDVIMHGHETIGSAERSTDVNEMRQEFHTISDGEYAKKLFNLFGNKRVINELENFLSMNFCPRTGGGIGVTRMINAMKRQAEQTA